MQSTLSTRVATSDDVLAMFEVIDAASYGAAEGYVRSAYRSATDIKKRLMAGLETCFVAMVDGAIVAVASVSRRAEPGMVSVPLIVTAEGHRSQGHATALLSNVLETLHELHLVRAFVICPQGNRGLETVLDRCEFQREGEMRDLYAAGQHGVIYGRTL